MKSRCASAPVWRSQVHGHKTEPAHALTPEERARVLRVATEPRFADRPPARIVPALADEGIYIASESTVGRVMGAEGQKVHRGRAEEPKQQRPATTYVANGTSELWCWDKTTRLQTS